MARKRDRKTGGVIVTIDEDMIRGILGELRTMPKKINPAKRAAVAATIRTARADLATDFKNVANLKVSTIKNKISETKRATTKDPTAAVTISKSRIPLWQFSRSKADLAGFQSQKGKRRGGKLGKKKEESIAAQGGKPGRTPPKGAGWKIWKGEKLKREKNFFTQVVSSGQIHILKRPEKAKGGNNAISGRDYRVAYGLSLVEILNRRWRRIEMPTEKKLKILLAKNLRSQVDRFLQRKKSDRA